MGAEEEMTEEAKIAKAKTAEAQRKRKETLAKKKAKALEDAGWDLDIAALETHAGTRFSVADRSSEK